MAKMEELDIAPLRETPRSEFQCGASTKNVVEKKMKIDMNSNGPTCTTHVTTL
jgi:hypothetical protein